MTAYTWTDPVAFVAGARAKAADLNTYVRDNLRFLANPPAARATDSGALVCTSGIDTALTLGTETYDTDGMHSTSTNTGRLTVVTGGLYVVSGYVNVTAMAGTSFTLSIWLNGSTGSRISLLGGPIAANTFHAGSGVFKATPGDYFVMGCLPAGGTTTVGERGLACVWVGYGN